MTRVLSSKRKEPVSGNTRSVVIFLHGYGANGADLLSIGDVLGDHLPDTLFVSGIARHLPLAAVSPSFKYEILFVIDLSA